MVDVGPVVEERVDDLQHSSFASGCQGCQVVVFPFDVLSPGESLLDLGCGGGREEARVLRGFGHFVGLSLLFVSFKHQQQKNETQKTNSKTKQKVAEDQRPRREEKIKKKREDREEERREDREEKRREEKRREDQEEKRREEKRREEKRREDREEKRREEKIREEKIRKENRR